MFIAEADGERVGACTRTVLLDLGNGDLLRIKRLYTVAPCAGWGYLVPKREIIGWATRVGVAHAG